LHEGGTPNPGGILTDQCQSIEKGMKNVLVGTIHRYCAWHILHKFPMKWDRKPNKDGLTEQLKSVVYGSVTKEEFEDRWCQLLKKLGYEHDSWFNELFRMRDKWVPIFLNYRFWASMTTTQRVEGINGFLKMFLTNKTSLGEFMLQFDVALMALWENEHDADHDSKYKDPTLLTCLPMEKQLRDSYTNCLYYKCRAEIARCMELQCKFSSRAGDYAVYIVTDFFTSRKFDVEFNHSSREVSCICRMFDNTGIICCHCIMVLKQVSITTLHEKYILDRWKKNFKRENMVMPKLLQSEPTEDSRYSYIMICLLD
jgi:hypothetical protein